jgi:hypothetical protein
MTTGLSTDLSTDVVVAGITFFAALLVWLIRRRQQRARFPLDQPAPPAAPPPCKPPSPPPPPPEPPDVEPEPEEPEEPVSQPGWHKDQLRAAVWGRQLVAQAQPQPRRWRRRRRA